MEAASRCGWKKVLRASAGWLLLSAVLGWIWAAAVPVQAQPDREAKREAAKPGDYDPHKHFTILKIEPDSAADLVKIHFSHPLFLGALKSDLRFLPRVKIDWSRTTMSQHGILTLQGKFRPGTGYLVTLPENYQLAGRTYVRTVHSFRFPDRLPKVEYVEYKTVIERDSRQLLHVRVQNITNLLLEGLRIPPLMLPVALVVDKKPWEWNEQALELFKTGAERLQGLVKDRKEFAPFLGSLQKEQQLFPATGVKNKVWAVSLPLSFRQGKEAGALMLMRVKDQAPGSTAVSPARLFQITDLGLTYKNSKDNLLLWATSLRTGAPVAGVQVLAFTRDLEVFHLGATDQDGILVLPQKEVEGLSLRSLDDYKLIKRQVEKDRITYLMAGTANDVAFIEVLPKGNVTPDNIWQVKDGDKIRRYQGHVFTERGVYRPGDKVFFKGTVREFLEGRIIPAKVKSVRVEITSPKGETVFTREGPLSAFGTLSGDLPVEGQWPLGTYTLIMSYGPEGAAAKPTRPQRRRHYEEDYGGRRDPAELAAKNEVSTTFMVQEFKAPRHFVEIDFKQASRTEKAYVNYPERTLPVVKIGVSGGYYAGGPVKHGQVRWKIYKTKTSYKVPGFEAYTFGHSGYEEEEGDRAELLESGQAILDDKGRTEVEFPLDSQALGGEYGLNVTATVLDFDGRSASATKAFQAEPDILVGISSHPPEVSAGVEQILKVVVATKDGKQIKTGAVKAEVMRRSYAYVAKRNEQGDVFWEDNPTWRRTFSTDLALDKGDHSFRFDFAYSGSYLISFTYRDEKGRAFTSASLLRVRGDADYDTYDNRERPYQLLDLSADRSEYTPGQTAKITVSPRRAVSRYLLTLEQAGVLKHQVVTLKEGQRTIEVPIQKEYAPNVYVSVLALTPRGAFPAAAKRYDVDAPSFFWGVLNLSVRAEVERLEVKIAPEVKELKAEPGAPMTLNFLVQDQKGKGVEAELAVAVVDEAVLALTAYKTPTLDQLVRFDGPLGVFTGELRLLLMHQTPFYLARNEPLTGGGGLGADLVAKLRKRFEPVAYFNPAVLTDAQGKARVSFTLPDNMTTYRVYVVAVDKGSRFASPERPLLVTKDFYLEPGMPSFFTQGDTFKFQVAAFNNTKASGTVKFSAVASEGGLVLKADEPTKELPANDSLKLSVSGQATKAGPAAARFGGQFGKLVDAVELKLKINSGHVRETNVAFGVATGSSELRMELPAYLTGPAAREIVPEEMKAVLTISGSPYLRMSEAIQYLLRYPYGCVEQTGSGVLALAAIRGAIKEGFVPDITLEEADKFLKNGVERILSMQTETGGFTYWPGQRETHSYGSMYAAAALSLAKANGLTVSEEAMTKMVGYLKEIVENEKHSLILRAYACYVLALAEGLDGRTLSFMTRDFNRLKRDSKILVLLAARISGLRPLKELQTNLKPLLSARYEVEPFSYDDFYAPYRGPALALMAAKAILPDDPLTKQAAVYLLGGLDRQGIWTSTSDTGWALVALNEYFKGVAFAAQPSEITVSQPEGTSQRLTVDPRKFRTVSLNPQAFLKAPVVRLEGPAGRTWLYKLEFTAPRLDLAGAGASQGFKIRRIIKNTDGKDEIRVGDLVKVTVVVEVTGRDQQYVVIDDPLPAGFVAINTALKTEEQVPGPREGENSGEGEEVRTNDDDEQTHYLTPDGAYYFYPNFFEIRDDRVLAFRDRVWRGAYRFEYYARAVCEGKFVLPAAKVAAMYSPDVYGLTGKGELVVKGR